MSDWRAHWEARWAQMRGETPPAPARVLEENLHLLPPRGAALDLACGLGANALLLAERGLETWAWDWSEQAVAAVRARAAGLTLEAQVRDVVADPPEPESFDVIVVVRFLERGLMPALQRALRPGGLLFYQTFVHEAVSDRGPRRRRFRLAPNELLSLLPDLRLVVYREEGRLGNLARGFRDEVLYIGQRVG